MADIADNASLRRRRQRGQRRQSMAGWRGVLSDHRFGLGLFYCMCAVLFAYAAATIYAARLATYYYDGAQLGMSTSQARYLFGAPQVIDAPAARWEYRADGRTLTLHFAPDGPLDMASCASGGGARFACPDILGLRVGSSEDDVTLTLGPPTRESYGDNTKTLYYDGLGLAFRMRLYMVEELRLREGASPSGYVSRALWMMVP